MKLSNILATLFLLVSSSSKECGTLGAVQRPDQEEVLSPIVAPPPKIDTNPDFIALSPRWIGGSMPPFAVVSSAIAAPETSPFADRLHIAGGPAFEDADLPRFVEAPLSIAVARQKFPDTRRTIDQLPWINGPKISIVDSVPGSIPEVPQLGATEPPTWYVLSDDPDFCYDDALPCGPSNWGGYCNKNNKGRQSPVDFTKVNTRLDGFLLNPLYRFKMNSAYKNANFDTFFIRNDGHSIQIDLPAHPTAEKLQISYDLLGRKMYKYSSLHFHWGRNGEYGAEHRVNSSNYVMEAHLVHFDEKFGSIEAAVGSKDPEALSVLGVFVQTCAGNSNPTPFAQVKQYVDEVATEPSYDMLQVKAPFSLTQFLPKSRHHYSYQGSLTTPACLELVKWTVFSESICITDEEIESFRKILTRGGEPIDTNHRPIQKLGSRRIAYYYSRP